LLFRFDENFCHVKSATLKTSVAKVSDEIFFALSYKSKSRNLNGTTHSYSTATNSPGETGTFYLRIITMVKPTKSTPS